MVTDEDDDDFEKTSLFQEDTIKVKMDPNFKVPSCIVLLVGPLSLVGRQWPLDKATQILGRSQSSNIIVDDPSVSKNHAQFVVKDNKVFIVDMGATNVTHISNLPLTPHKPHELKNNDQIRTGGLIFKFLARGILSETNEKNRMQTELESAKNVQETLLPIQSDVNYNGIQVGGRYHSAVECGGDWWWHWSCAGKAFVIIGDATGHGAPAALITSAARSAVATLEDNETVQLESIYSILSNAILKCTGGKLSMSAFLIEVDLATKKLRYINASHLSAVLLPMEATDFTWKNLKFLTEPISPSLGSENNSCSIGEMMVTPETRLVLLTDGLTERIDSRGQQLTERAFYKMLIEAHTKHPRSQTEFLNMLLRKSAENAQFALLEDDITLVTIDFLANAGT